MYRLSSDFLRGLMAIPFAIAIPREAPASIEVARTIAEDFGLWPLIAVGDVVTMNIGKYWREPDISIIDGKTQRRIISESSSDAEIIIDNPPATLMDSAFEAIRGAVRIAMGGGRATILVRGEEDLLAIPAVLVSPPRSAVVYGLYTGYLVLIPVTQQYKLLMLKLLTLMQRIKA
ncbi:MAG: DUF359 domain-containing protein [Thermocladium sp.]